MKIFKFDDEAENRLVRTIHSDDKMYLGNAKHYFSVMQSAIRAISVSLYAANRDNIRSILDFGCGFGRVQRGLRAVFPNARIVATDINRVGVDFCTEQFGAVSWYQDAWPPVLPDGETYDLIWAGSVMTHLPATRTTEAVNLLIDRLATGGVLVSTFHGRYSIHRQKNVRKYVSGEKFEAIERGYENEGYGFSGAFNENYGFSVSRPSWVLDLIGRRQDVKVVTYLERGWDNHQDVLACLKENLA